MHGIVLAAGTGARMGGPKARLLVHGETLLASHVRRLREAGCDGVVAVVGAPDASLVEDAVVAISSAPDPAGSLRIGLGAVPTSADVVVITPVDVLPASTETIAALRRALDGDVVAATPRHEGKGGHPVVIRRSALEGFAGTLHDVLTKLGDRRARIEVSDMAITTDLDTPADVEALTGAPPKFLR